MKLREVADEFTNGLKGPSQTYEQDIKYYNKRMLAVRHELHLVRARMHPLFTALLRDLKRPVEFTGKGSELTMLDPDKDAAEIARITRLGWLPVPNDFSTEIRGFVRDNDEQRHILTAYERLRARVQILKAQHDETVEASMRVEKRLKAWQYRQSRKKSVGKST